ncbi:MAG: transcription termination/antitermination protein NusG [Christensenellaceae bacterium]
MNIEMNDATESNEENILVNDELQPENNISTSETEDKQKFIKQEKTDKPYWYVVYTYSGYENKVMDNLLKTVENHNLQETIIDVKVPMEESVEVKNGKKRHVSRKMFPGYVMVKMFLTDESWYVVRNTRGVTGFVGPSSKPIPLSDAEVRSMGIENVRISLDVEVGNNIIVTSGPLESFVGLVEEVNLERQKVHVLVSMFGRDTSVELDFVQVKRI